MNETLQFAQPVWIWIGLAICVALGFGMARWNRRRDRDLEKLAHTRLLKQLTESVSRRRRVFKQALWLVALFLVFVAVARPQYGFEYREVKRRGIDLVFAIDTSRSMLAEDVVPDRLERARLAVTDFVQKLEGDRVALIPFAGNAFSLCPLTLDYSAFFQSLDALDTEIIPHQGTDLATAVEEANRLFDEEGNNHRILILITDGEDLQGSVMNAVATAKEKGMTIHTVGVGDPAGALIPIRQADGSQDFVRDENGEPVRTALDEETLQQIAQATSGIYAPLGGAGQGLETIYQEKLRLVPKSDFDQRLDQIPLERFEWPLAVAIALLFLEFLLSERRRQRRRKAPVISVARRNTASAAILGGLLLNGASLQAQELPEQETFDDPRAAYNAGTSAFRDGEFARAEQTLSATLGNTDDLSLQQRSYYNLGNTRYRIGQQTVEEQPDATIKKWEEAVKSFDDALALNPEDEDARFNRDFVQKKLEELKRQQEEEKQEQQNQQEQDQQQDQEEQQQDQENQEQSSNEQQESDQEDQSEESESESGEENSEEQQSSESESESQNQDGQSQEEEQEDSESESEEDQKGQNGQEQEQKQADSGSEGEEEQDSKSEQEETAEPDKEKSSSEEAEDAEQKEPQPGAGEEEKEKDSEKEKEGEQQATPEPTGEPQGAQEEQQEGAPGSFSEERREPGEMSREEAAQLLEALEKDEQSVIPLPDINTYRRSVPNNTTRGKTW